ncbi:MAG: co-chaperone DjlA [Pseudomonadota bacterium]
MSWWGKLVGGTFGFMLGGPIGAMLGAAVGHSLDKGLKSLDDDPRFAGPGNQERIQSVFFTATFSVMGHIAKADGRVSEDEIAIARSVMQQMSLDAEQTRVAMNLFNQGKQDDFDLDAVVAQFKAECGRRRTLIQMFLEILLHAAYADRVLHPQEEKLLKKINASLGFSTADFARIAAMVRAQHLFGGTDPGAPSPAEQLKEAYAVMGVSPSDDDATVKKAYRRLMNQHHPDKLIAKGLPEEMMKLATEKTQEIKSAYELIKKSRSV